MNDIKVPMARLSRSEFARSRDRCAGCGWETLLLLYEAQQSLRKAGASLLEGQRLLPPELEMYRYDVIKE